MGKRRSRTSIQILVLYTVLSAAFQLTGSVSLNGSESVDPVSIAVTNYASKVRKTPFSATQSSMVTTSDQGQSMSEIDMDSNIDYVANASQPAQPDNCVQCDCSRFKDEIICM